MLNEMSRLPDLVQLELINFDIRPGFDIALASCTNIRRLLLIPTYVTQVCQYVFYFTLAVQGTPFSPSYVFLFILVGDDEQHHTLWSLQVVENLNPFCLGGYNGTSEGDRVIC